MRQDRQFERSTRLPGGTVTFLFTDVEGSTGLLHELGAEEFARVLSEHHAICRTAIAQHGGIEVDTQGDAFFVAFASADEALAAAAEVQRELRTHPIDVRMGLHTGMPLVTPEGYRGIDVVQGARIAAAAHGGQVLVSAATHGALSRGELPFKDLGEHRLKDFDEPVSIFQLGTESFPPLKTISNTNIPHPASSFVGRERELGEVLSLGRDARVRLLTLTGPGGSGKTRLALETALELLPEYPNGVFWIGLASVRDSGLVLTTIAQTLGARGPLAPHIGDRQMLLLLDNFEQVVDAAASVSELLAVCPRLDLLVTSRELLRVRGEVDYRVQPLAPSEAVALFCERAHLLPDHDIERLCLHLDNLPLAVELAAARTNVLTPSQIVTRLTERLDVLVGGRDADARQSSLRATMEWSHDLLDEPTKTLFARLSIFSTCTVEGAELVCDASVDTLAALVDKSLLRRSGDRLFMLETLRQYARERLEDGLDLPRVARRHAEYITALAEEAEPRLMRSGGGAWMKRLHAELADIRLALEWSRDHDVEIGLRLVGSLPLFWMEHNLLAEGDRWCAELLTLGEDASAAARAKALNCAAVFAGIRGNHADAEPLHENALALCRELGDLGGIAWALTGLATPLAETGRSEQAREYLEEALPIHREVGDELGVKRTVQQLGTVLSELGDVGHGRALLHESIEIAHGQGDRFGEIVSRHSLGDLELRALHLGDARSAYRAALESARAIDSARMACYCLAGLSAVAAACGESKRAVRLWRYVEQLEAELGVQIRPALRARYQERLDPDGREPLQTSGDSVLVEATEYALAEG